MKPGIIFSLPVMLAAALLTACESGDKPTDSVPADAIQLVYSESEPGVDPYTSKVVITDDFIRIDDSGEGRSFVLFDRKKKIIYSVSEENEAILVVDPDKDQTRPEFKYKLAETTVDDKNIPSLNGKQGVHYRYSIDNRACIDAVVISGFLDEAVAAYREYRAVLAEQHLAGLKDLPMDTQFPCDLAINAFEPNRYLEHGFPVLERTFTGYSRSLVSFEENYKPEAGLFTLPKEFGVFSLKELREQALEAEARK